MSEKEMVICPVCEGNPRRWLSYNECMANGVRYPAYEDCNNCEDGYVEVETEDNPELVCDCPEWDQEPNMGIYQDICVTCGLPIKERKRSHDR